jgi:hypothetical protein
MNERSRPNREYDTSTFGGFVAKMKAEKKRNRDLDWVRTIRKDNILNT